MKNKDKAVERLCQAIIVQAAQDYLEETKVLKELLSCEPPPDPPKPPVKNGEKKVSKKKGLHKRWEDKCYEHRYEIKSIELFFHSHWYQMLSETDGAAVFQKLKEESDKI
ncbi:MAG: hypothetical protein LUC38_03270 [Oscillospiraceae bacterium]|nr:hypothetical protein [Ruminococcus sp.]MCD8344963.1 hypothetical protein [Oscillospiraceae bacterium]